MSTGIESPLNAARHPNPEQTPSAQTVLMSSVLSGLSAVLDVTEGHPAGHAARACLIGMRLVRALKLPPDEVSDVFYGLLLKDAGGSSNAGRVFQLFGGPEHATKRAVWLRDWRRLSEQVRYALEAVDPGGSLPSRIQRLFTLGVAGRQASRELFEICCDRDPGEGSKGKPEIGVKSHDFSSSADGFGWEILLPRTAGGQGDRQRPFRDGLASARCGR